MKRISLVFLLSLCACHHPEKEDNLVLIQIQDRNGLSETFSTPDRLTSYNHIDFLTSQPYKKVQRVYRKEGKNRSIITTYHPNGVPWQMLEAKEMRANGAFREWFPSGTKRIEASLIGGIADLAPENQSSWLFDGPALVWNETEHLIARLNYDKGVLSGSSTYYYPSGALEKEVVYVQDKIEGDVKELWEHGELKAKTTYRNGLKEGVSIALWPNGTSRWEEVYREGRLESGTYFDLSSKIIAEVKEAAGFQPCYEGTRLVQMQEIRKGIVEGLVKVFDISGQLHCTYFLKNGKKTRRRDRIFFTKPFTQNLDQLGPGCDSWSSENVV